MKRYLCLFMILALICPCFLVGVSAATSYRFEMMPPVSLYAEYDFLFGVDSYGVYEGQVPAGTYYLRVFDGNFECSTSSFELYYSQDESGYVFGYFDCVMSFAGPSVIWSFVLLDDYYASGFSMLGILSGDGGLFDPADGLILELVSVDDQPTFLGFLSADMFDFAFDEVVSLLPVLLGCVVSFLGIRKGIAYLQRVLKGV